MVNLLISFYEDSNIVRQKELSEALQLNLENRLIDRIFLVSEQTSISIVDKKIEIVRVDIRPTYNDFFRLTHKYSNDINIIANSDIWFDEENIQKLKDYRWRHREVFALTRWTTKNEFYGHPFSQDCWIINGRIETLEQANFSLGKPGCDGKISYLLSNSGYQVRNPSLSIKSYHNHFSEIRKYTTQDTLPKPYKNLTPTLL